MVLAASMAGSSSAKSVTTFNLTLKEATGSELLFQISSFFDKASFSDLTIKAKGGRSFKCHRIVVCPQSKPLAAHVSAGFLEATTGIINLEDDDEQTVEHFLKYLYSGNYSVSTL